MMIWKDEINVHGLEVEAPLTLIEKQSLYLLCTNIGEFDLEEFGFLITSHPSDKTDLPFLSIFCSWIFGSFL